LAALARQYSEEIIVAADVADSVGHAQLLQAAEAATATAELLATAAEVAAGAVPAAAPTAAASSANAAAVGP
jgi:hypothetical protein